MKKLTIAGIGELLWDIYQEVEEIGGAPINFTYHITALGAKGIPISTIGRDDRGKKAIAELEKRGLDVSAISVVDNHATGYVSATIDGEGVASYNFPDKVAWDHLQVNNYVKMIQSKLDAVCFGSLAQRSKGSRVAIYRFLDSLNTQTVRVFDVNLRQNFYSRKIIESSLRRTDILKLNDEELQILARLLDFKETGKEGLTVLVDRYNLRMAILTRGSNGSVLMTPNNFSDHPGIATSHIVDTIGAGDSFTAATTIGYLQGLELDDINEKANKLAAYVCSQQGAMPSIPEFLK
ncbi:MAG: carbohydrate kinase [Desulfobulbaceae bacterium S3730MH12]|nr:MAG: carbohydrate kinase [Desulfobulbaceae bacterium S3730MH12]